MKIVNIHRNSTPTKVYDFTVADVHHYILSNGVVTHNSYVPMSEMSGGMGLKYVSDCIVMLSKSKEKDKDKNVIGNIIKIKMIKSRLSRENTQVDTRISYTGGLDRYAGVLDMAEASGLVTKAAGGRYKFPHIESAVFESVIAKDPEKYFTPEFLQRLDDEYVKPTFTYGSSLLPDVSEFEEVDE